jgi:hypothetical protein
MPGLAGIFYLIVLALQQLARFGEAEKGPVHRKFILACVFRDMKYGFDLVAVVAEKLNDEIGIYHYASTSERRMPASDRDGARGKILLAGRVAR